MNGSCFSNVCPFIRILMFLSQIKNIDIYNIQRQNIAFKIDFYYDLSDRIDVSNRPCPLQVTGNYTISYHFIEEIEKRTSALRKNTFFYEKTLHHTGNKEIFEQTWTILVLHKHAAGSCGKSISVNFPQEGMMSPVLNFTFFSSNFTPKIQTGLVELSLGGGGIKQ